ncbi:MAG: hypothetical protein EOS02_09830 [Mesorhizobium sp.]|nr:MAG: hypothetical protein EOS02_09830 [Mesorhizobium sp.]
MNFVSEGPAPGQVDPRDLTAAQLAALRIVQGFRLNRVKNGWRAPGSPLVTLAMAQFLGGKRLLMRRTVAGKERIEVTGTGMNTLTVADARRRKAA